MNDGTNIASDDIILKPKFRYWLMTVSYTHLTLPTILRV